MIQGLSFWTGPAGILRTMTLINESGYSDYAGTKIQMIRFPSVVLKEFVPNATTLNDNFFTSGSDTLQAQLMLTANIAQPYAWRLHNSAGYLSSGGLNATTNGSSMTFPTFSEDNVTVYLRPYNISYQFQNTGIVGTTGSVNWGNYTTGTVAIGATNNGSGSTEGSSSFTITRGTGGQPSATVSVYKNGALVQQLPCTSGNSAITSSFTKKFGDFFRITLA